MELGISFNYSELSSFNELKTALISGNIDAFCVDKSILRGYVDENIEILDESFDPQDYGIVTQLSDKELAQYIDDFVAELKAGSTLHGQFTPEDGAEISKGQKINEKY